MGGGKSPGPDVTWSWDSGGVTWDQMEGRETKGAAGAGETGRVACLLLASEGQDRPSQRRQK